MNRYASLNGEFSATIYILAVSKILCSPLLLISFILSELKSKRGKNHGPGPQAGRPAVGSVSCLTTAHSNQLTSPCWQGST